MRWSNRFGFEIAVSNYLHSHIDDKLELYGEPYINEDGHFCQCANDDSHAYILEMVDGKIKLTRV